MNFEIKIFGQLKDIFEQDNIVVAAAKDTNELLENLETIFPLLKEKTFAIAVDKKIISGNTDLFKDSEIALLPPFSGG